MSEQPYDIAIIGGGAAGMMAAIQAKTCCPALRIAVLERQPRLGKKLLATGNGRCNLANMDATPAHYHNAAFVGPALTRFPPHRILDAFDQLGLRCAVEEDGRVYPLSDQAASVLDVLRLSLAELGATVMPDFDVTSLLPGFLLRGADGHFLRARCVILATGGPAAPRLGGTAAGHRLLKSLGHPIAPCLPALSQLCTPPEQVRALKGIRVACGLTLCVEGKAVESTQGEVLFTEYGLSGIAAMALARRAGAALAAKQQPIVHIALLTESRADVLALLTARRANWPNRLLDDFLTGLVAKRLGQLLLKGADAVPLSRFAASLTEPELCAIADLLVDWPLPLLGTRDMDGAQVTAGGAYVSHFDSATLQSTLVPGLFAAGEVLDVDGPCGGYNLTWAWASGLLAAEACIERLKGTEYVSLNRPQDPPL